jgi:protocadherin Fat 4
LLIGGVTSADPLLERPGQLRSDDFVGCVHSVTINGYSMNLSNPISSKAVDPFCNRQGLCAQSLTLCGEGSSCLDRWNGVMCKCEDNDVLSPNCFQAFKPVSLGEGSFLEYKITEKHRRMHLLESIYNGTTVWRQESRIKRSSLVVTPVKELSLMFRTMKSNATILLAASNSDFTLVKVNIIFKKY